MAAAVVVSASAHAFCGFYVAGGGASLFNNATQVVLMREGTRTVLSMQNNYQGPPENFAMVIPVPVVLQKENVKTLTKDIFNRVDQLSAPRLVEYWEMDPCFVEDERKYMKRKGGAKYEISEDSEGGGGLGVKVEAQFTVGEYEIVILSAKDALGLETWLKQNKYKIPEGSEPLFRPYIQQGMKFFVARVDTKKVQFKDGMADLSPLRFHYDSEKFELPVRLGLINAKSQQDLIVNIIARNQRYEVANYPNVTIPTNIDLVPSAKSEFPYFYVSLFDRTVKANPKAVVTEYAWQASSCDPCPTSPLSAEDFATLGADGEVDAGQRSGRLCGAQQAGCEIADRQPVPHNLAAIGNSEVAIMHQVRDKARHQRCLRLPRPKCFARDAGDKRQVTSTRPPVHQRGGGAARSLNARRTKADVV
jgi:hypothetical protein